MRSAIRWRVAVLAMALTFSEAGSAQKAHYALDEKRIEVVGVMAIVPGGRTLGSISLDDGRCFDLALPDSVLKQRRSWQNTRVMVSGPLMYWPQGLVAGLMWIDIKDRKVEGLGCSGSIIYVEGIRRL